MQAKPDKILLEIDARYSFRLPPGETVTLAESRKRSHEARLSLFGRHHDEVDVTESPLGSIYRSRLLRNGSEDIVLFIHGGGWCKCDLVTHGSILTDLAGLSGRDIYGLTYPLAPEAPYPAALDGLIDQIDAIVASTGRKIILAGDSAGANLALGLALRARNEGKNWPLSALLLWYGCFRYKFDTTSHLINGDGSNGLTTDGMRQMWDDYLSGHEAPIYGDLSKADLRGLPPAYLCEAECDCLGDDTKWLAAGLAEQGIAHYYDIYPGTIHGFVHFSAHYAPSYQSLKKAAGFVDLVCA